MITSQQRSIIALLASSLLLTIGRGATLPFMTIYLNSQYGMAVDEVGFALSVAMTVGVFFSLGFGILADRFDKKRYMLIAIAIFVLSFIGIPLSHDAVLVVIFFSIINCAYSVFATVVKAYFSDTLAPTAKSKVFSLNYSFLNIGWTVGPPLGTLLVMQSSQLPFWLAAGCAAFPLVFIQLWVQRVRVKSEGEISQPWSPSVLLHDKALLWFTLSGLLASFVSGSFASCISQYVMAVADNAFAQKVVALVLPVNAVIVVMFQYVIGRSLRASNIRPMMAIGTLCFVLGLLGFMSSGSQLWLWGLSAAVFTVGEIIYAPGEYMLIDNIAPPGMKASYFSAQALGWLGAAMNPLATGIILTTLPGWTLFAILAATIVMAWLMMLRGMQVRPWDSGLSAAKA